MITGIVDGNDARIQLEVRGKPGKYCDIQAVVDTGFTATLSLPPKVIESLELTWKSVGRGVLADGSECLFDIYEATILWDGHPRRILVDEADTDPLVGMGLLRGYELNIQVRTGGEVTIRRLESDAAPVVPPL